MNRSFLTQNLLVFVGAGLGGGARWGVGLLAARAFPDLLPCWATFFINVTGCFAMGALMYRFKDRGLMGTGHRLFYMVGVLGGYTTFCSFGYEADALWRQGRGGVELTYVLSSVVLGLVAVSAGRGLARMLWGAGAAAPVSGHLEEEAAE